MFILPLVLLPFVFGLALHRLVQIPRRLLKGELRWSGARRPLWPLAGAAAYMALLGYTLFLGARLAHLFLVGTERLPAYLAFAAYVAGYLVVYVAAAWVFYYALVPARRAEG